MLMAVVGTRQLVCTTPVTAAYPKMEIISLPTSAVRGSPPCTVALASAELVLSRAVWGHVSWSLITCDQSSSRVNLSIVFFQRLVFGPWFGCVRWFSCDTATDAKRRSALLRPSLAPMHSIRYRALTHSMYSRTQELENEEIETRAEFVTRFHYKNAPADPGSGP